MLLENIFAHRPIFFDVGAHILYEKLVSTQEKDVEGVRSLLVSIFQIVK